MSMKSDIRRMYQEIVEYDGDFGDSIETGSYNPLSVVADGPVTGSDGEGIGVALLCYLMTSIDNGTYEDAISDGQARAARLAIRNHVFRDMPCIHRALAEFFVSEIAFMNALKEVYATIVVPRASAATQQGDGGD